MFFMKQGKVCERIGLAQILTDDIPDSERLNRVHLASLFATKVFDSCRAHDTTPWSATGDEVDLMSLMAEAERQLGIAYSESELSAMNKWQRYEVKYLVHQRRQYAYSLFIRMTSVWL